MNDIKNISILVIDDERQIVEILQKCFEGLGHDVTGETDPEQALKLIKDNSYDVVFTDLMMPKVTGMDIIKTIKELENDTKIVVFTGYASVDSAINALQLGVHDYIRKPFHLNEITKVLNQATEKLMLERENIELHAKLERMLTNIQILYDISNILYQISDPESIYEMAFDTLSESMGFNHACFMQRDDESAVYAVSHSRGLPENIIAELTFGLDDTIGGHKISGESILVLENEEGTLNIGDRSLKLDLDHDKLIIIPIMFLDKVTAFLCIFSDNNMCLDVEDDLSLLRILATQIAPISNTVMSRNMEVSHIDRAQLSSAFSAINDAIIEAEATDSIVSFAMLRLKDENAEDSELSFSGVRDVWHTIVSEELDEAHQIFWDGDDTILISAVSENQAALEHHSASIRQKIEHQSQTEDELPGVSMSFGVCSYPYDGISAKEIHQKLGSTLFYSEPIGMNPGEVHHG